MSKQQATDLQLPTTLKAAHQRIHQQQTLIQELTTRIEDLEERLATHSGNSSTPPSQDRYKRQGAAAHKKSKSTRKKGAQPGHEKHERVLLDEDQVDQLHRHYPESHCACGQALQLEKKPAKRHQIFDLPEIKYTVTEYQCYAGICPACGQRQVAQLPDTLPRGQMGAGLISWISLLNGQHSLSLRQIQTLLKTQWQLDFSLGAISQSQRLILPWLQPLYTQIGEATRQSELAHADETTHDRNRSRYWLWTLCTDSFVYLMTHYSRGKAAAQCLLGDFKGLLVTDRDAAYNDQPPSQHQYCWAHLVRNLEKISLRKGEAGVLGKRLLRLAQWVFVIQRLHRCRVYSEATWRSRMERLQETFRIGIQTGTTFSSSPKTARQCQRLLKDEARFWTFLLHPPLTVPLTNNLAERTLRPYVIWRKNSFFSQSARGDQFRPMILSLIETAKRQKLNSYTLLRTICEQGIRGQDISFRWPVAAETPKLAL